MSLSEYKNRDSEIHHLGSPSNVPFLLQLSVCKSDPDPTKHENSKQREWETWNWIIPNKTKTSSHSHLIILRTTGLHLLPPFSVGFGFRVLAMSTFSKGHASSSCSSSTAASALHHLRGDEEEGGVRDMRNAKVDIFSRLFVALGLCLAFRVNAQQLLLTISNAAHQFGGTLIFKNEDDSTTKIHDIERGAMQPSTERQTSEDARESSPLTDERLSDDGTVKMLPNSTVQTNINNGQQQNAVNGLLSRDESTTENRTFGFDINPSTPWLCMPWIMAAVIILLGLLVPFL